MKIGLLLPHFGRHCTSSRLTDGVSEIERLGFDSVWVRDHLVYRPHSFEDPDVTFQEPFTVLAAAAARTSRLALGTATLIPYRHPIHSALHIASLTALSGAGRLIVGWGTGNDPREFAATGTPRDKRGALLEEHVEVVRKLAGGQPVSHHGANYAFEDVHIHAPVGDVPFWYGGGTPRAMERTALHFDGLLASRMPLTILRERIGYLRELAARVQRKQPEIGLVTFVSPGATVEAAMAAFDVARVGADTARRFPGREWDQRSGFDGVLIAGRPDDIAAQLSAFREAGVDHFIIDMRARFAEWESVVEEVAVGVLPEFGR